MKRRRRKRNNSSERSLNIRDLLSLARCVDDFNLRVFVCGQRAFYNLIFLLYIKTVCIIGEATYPEEAVDTDYPTGTAGKRELLEREEQPHLYAAKGNFLLKFKIYIKLYISFTLKRTQN